jgi:hypothetical protein
MTESSLARKCLRYWSQELNSNNSTRLGLALGLASCCYLSNPDSNPNSATTSTSKNSVDMNNKSNFDDDDDDGDNNDKRMNQTKIAPHTVSKSAYLSKNLPFDYEKSWFEKLENNKIKDDEEIICNNSIQSVSVSNLASPIISIPSNLASDGQGQMLCNDLDETKRPYLSIIHPEPRFNRISGFNSRQQRQSIRYSSAPIPNLSKGLSDHDVLDGSSNEASQNSLGSPGGREQWWPWLYEVLCHQWCSLLVAFQASHSTRGNTTYSKTAPTSPVVPGLDGLGSGSGSGSGLGLGNGRPSTVRVMSIAPYPLDIQALQKSTSPSQQLKG